ncbi:MAG: GNAT family N-acetyltransferase [Prochloraceae cyanobacterium]
MFAKEKIEESKLQFSNNWKYFASKCPQPECFETENLSFAWGNVNNIFFNAIFVLTIPKTRTEVKFLIKSIKNFTGDKSLPWWLIICNDSISSIKNLNLQQLLADNGFKELMKLTGMATDCIAYPTNSNHFLKCKPIKNLEDRKSLSKINAISYEILPAQFQTPLETEEFWEERVFGTIGYIENKPVSSAIILWIENKFYLAFVATLPEYRQKGYAKIVIRHCLTQAEKKYGKCRMILHATSMGASVYEKLGYKPTAYFSTYTSYF